MPRARTVILAFTFSIILIGAVGIAAADQPLEDGSFYWEGSVIVAEDYTDADEVSIYTRGGSHVTNITTDGGGFEIDTEELGEGRYYVDAPDAEKVSFEIVRQDVDVDVNVVRSSDGPPFVTGTVDVSSNRATDEFHVYGMDDLAEHATGDFEKLDADSVSIGSHAQITISLDHIAGGSESIRADDPETGESGISIFDIPPITSPPDVEAVAAERGGTYWAGETLAFQSADIHEDYSVETIGGAHIATNQAATDGRLYINTTTHDGDNYRILNTETDEELTRYELREQTLTAELEEDTLHIESNRQEFEASVTITNESDIVSAETIVVDGGAADVTLDRDNLSAGDYTLQVEVEDTNASAETSFAVVTETATPQETETPTASPTPTSTDVSTTVESTATPRTEATTTSGDESDVSAPGFGFLVAVVALLLVGVLARRSQT